MKDSHSLKDSHDLDWKRIKNQESRFKIQDLKRICAQEREREKNLVHTRFSYLWRILFTCSFISWYSDIWVFFGLGRSTQGESYTIERSRIPISLCFNAIQLKREGFLSAKEISSCEEFTPARGKRGKISEGMGFPLKMALRLQYEEKET